MVDGARSELDGEGLAGTGDSPSPGAPAADFARWYPGFAALD